MSLIMPAQSGGEGRPDTAFRLLGQRIRTLRKARGISAVAASKVIAHSPSNFSRMECGLVPIRESDLHKLLTLYGVADSTDRQALHDLNARLAEPRWWNRPGGGDLPEWFCSYLVLESTAWWIGAYESRFIPGLLQTEAYAATVIGSRCADPDRVRRLVDIRIQRQRRMLDRGGPGLWAIVDESALLNNFRPDVMRAQLEHLRQLMDLPNVTIQVIRLTAGAQAERSNSFSIMRLRGSLLPEVVYLEQLDHAMFIGSALESEPYRLAWEQLEAAAERTRPTRLLLERALRRASNR